MAPRPLYLRLLGVAAATTVAITGLGVLLGSAGQSPAAASSAGGPAPAPLEAFIEAVPEPPVPLPEVPQQRAADFSAGDDLPDGSRVFNTGSNQTGMSLSGGVLGHGEPVGPGAAGFVETKLTGEVRSLGVRVRFANGTSGSVALVGWKSSIVSADREGGPTPATGLRLVAAPGSWELTAVDQGEVHVLASGTYTRVVGAATFEVRRDGSTLYVVDPAGAVTVVEDKRAVKLAGPWASWGLTETGPDQTPAAIEAVWAG